MKLPIIYEKIVTPKSIMKDITNFSSVLFGTKSPYPIVLIVVMP
jgi:hypothetical protein